ASSDKTGLFEAANGGTILLDEIGELPLGLQAKLLRVLQENEIRRVGDQRTRRVDARVLAATARDLEAEVRGGRFREDLFYRIHVVVIELPPLRERQDDIAPLSRHFAARLAQRFGRPLSLGEDAIAWLEQQPWRGGAAGRELADAVLQDRSLWPRLGASASRRAVLCTSAVFCGVSRRRISTYLLDVFAVTPRHRTCIRDRSNGGSMGRKGFSMIE